MPGLQNFHGNRILALLILASTLLGGCGGSSTEVREVRTEPTLDEFLAKYEPAFIPSRYNEDVRLLLSDEQHQYAMLHVAEVYATTLPETIPGFRIQVIATREIDQANAVRDSLESLLPAEWSYTVYDAPYYKVRVGNYPDRASAASTLRRLAVAGFGDAWIVPDNVLKNPPPIPPEDEFIVPKRFDGRQQ